MTTTITISTDTAQGALTVSHSVEDDERAQRVSASWPISSARPARRASA